MDSSRPYTLISLVYTRPNKFNIYQSFKLVVWNYDGPNEQFLQIANDRIVTFGHECHLRFLRTRALRCGARLMGRTVKS